MTQDGGYSLKRTLLTAAPLVIAPIVALNALLAFNLGATAQREIDSVAKEVLRITTSRLDDAATALVALEMEGARDCGPASKAALAAAAARVGAAQDEVAVVDSTGLAICSAQSEPRVVTQISPEHGTLDADVTLIVGIGSTSSRQMIRLQSRGQDGRGFRILIPSEEIFPYFIRSEFMPAFIADAVMIDGATIARKLTDPSLARPDDSRLPAITATAASQRYPLRINITTPGRALMTAHGGLFLYANLGGLALAFLAAAVALIVGRRSGGPIREMHDAIRNGEFIPYYQPVIDIVSGRLAGCEVLVRWIKPDGKLVRPGRFISLAEASGEIFPMTLALMEAARDDLSDLYGDRPQLKLGFNLFAGHFDDVTIVADVERIFASAPIRMTQLMFEVTERQPLQDVPRARQVIAKLQSLGARVALDDVGTGHGGLSYLLKLGVDVMKMDKMFVDAIGTDRYSIAIIDSMVKLADDMNLDLIAEGVETIDQLEYLRGKGVRMAQGYVFAPPLPASSFKLLVEAMAPIDRRPARGEARYVGALRGAQA